MANTITVTVDFEYGTMRNEKGEALMINDTAIECVIDAKHLLTMSGELMEVQNVEFIQDNRDCYTYQITV